MASRTEVNETAIFEYLQKEYAGIFPPSSIEDHFNNHVGFKTANTRFEYIVEHANVNSLLDIGSGYGSFVLLSRKAGIDAKGLEIAEFETKIARQRLGKQDPMRMGNEVFFQGTAYSLPFPDETFDAVTLWDVLEHVESHEKVLDEACRVLKKGGRIFISCPNYLSFRKEAHYQVFWLPLLPKTLASRYLQILGRDPRFLQNSIHYKTNWQILKCLKRRGFVLHDSRIQKIKRPELIHRKAMQFAIRSLNRLGFDMLLSALLKLQTHNPFKKSILLCAAKRS